MSKRKKKKSRRNFLFFFFFFYTPPKTHRWHFTLFHSPPWKVLKTKKPLPVDSSTHASHKLTHTHKTSTERGALTQTFKIVRRWRDVVRVCLKVCVPFIVDRSFTHSFIQTKPPHAKLTQIHTHTHTPSSQKRHAAATCNHAPLFCFWPPSLPLGARAFWCGGKKL